MRCGAFEPELNIMRIIQIKSKLLFCFGVLNHENSILASGRISDCCVSN